MKAKLTALRDAWTRFQKTARCAYWLWCLSRWNGHYVRLWLYAEVIADEWIRDPWLFDDANARTIVESDMEYWEA